MPVFLPPAWISSLHDGWRIRKQNTNCKNVADGPPSHASLCTDLLSCRSVHVLSTPSLPESSIGCRDTQVAASLSADRGECDREIFATLRHVPSASDDGSDREGSPRCGRLPVRTASSSSAYPSAVRERSVGPSSWDPDARRICPPTAEEASPVLRVSSFSTTLSSTLDDAVPLSAAELPREASSTASSLTLPTFACSPLLTPPPLHLLLFRPLLPPLHVATGTTTTVRDTTTAATASTTPPPPPSPGLPHLQSRPGGFPTT